ncbi:MAG: LPS-assembly protein LptD [Pseudidiomarina mangrovi]|nr:MAG: LPS-assembly protein LptD [Pseudidiomarina mangrovi]
MRKNLAYSTSLALFLSAAGSTVANAQQSADAYGVCAVPQALIKNTAKPFVQLPMGAIGVRADRADVASDTQVASFFGNVEVQLDEQQLWTEQAQINQQSGNINASGATRFSDGYVQVASENFRLNSAENRAYLSGARYQIGSTGAHGKADLLALEPQQVILSGSTFTTCPSDDPAWQLSAQTIQLNEDEAWGEAWHARFELFGVPVLYVPYINFPINDERKSGLLFPTIRSSQQNGFEVELPYYINIAANQDATITPRYMAERGLMMQAEYRYRSQNGGGEFNLSYLGNDKAYTSDNSRFQWRVEHQQVWSEQWRTYVHGVGISDDDYLSDFGSDFAGRADAQLYRHAQADYRSDSWRVTIRAEDFELLGNYRSPYRTLPQISSVYVASGALDLEYQVASEISHFRNQDDSRDYATRVHIEPQVRYHMERPGYDWLAEVGYSYTYYDQAEDLASGRSANPSRGLPHVRWRGRLNFERLLSFAGKDYRQTLEPQVQYLWTPYRDQSGIGIYDATLMQDDYRGLFRARRFSGLDRIADANQVTVGASSSLYDSSSREVFRFSAAQIYYFEDSRTELLGNTGTVTASRSDLALESRIRISDRWYFNSALQYDMELNRTQKSQTAVEYRKDQANLVQFSHRNVTTLLGDNIEQLGVQAVFELSPQWQLASNWYYDLGQKRTNDALFAVQYSDCCWAFRIGAYRRINRSVAEALGSPIVGTPEFDNGISVQFIIKGLGSDNRSLIDLLEQSLFGYRHPFHLSN